MDQTNDQTNDQSNDQSKSNTPHDPTPPHTGKGYMKLAGVEDGEYDALADLFLGESELAPEPFSNTGTDAIDQAPVRLGPATTHPIPTYTEETAPAIPNPPVQVMPRLTIDEPTDHLKSFDELPTTGTIPCIETVLLGHLPVRASLWVRQYACSTARRRGEVVALIRAAAGSTSVDLISGDQPIQSAECDSLHQALSAVNTIADRIILRVDETTEPELLDRGEIDEITILTGADEAAIVASYRLIKTLTGVWDTDGQVGTPHLRLAVMGATGQQAADASAKLTRAVDAFLDRPIEIIDAAGRIDATGTTNIFRDTIAHQATHILDEIIEIGCGLPELIPEDHYEPAPQIQITPEPAPTIIEPTPMVTQPAQPTASTKEGLYTLIEGLTRLETRCPFALEVEMCIDSTGSLHLVTDELHEGPMARLETVRAWVRDHLSLILRAESTLAVPSSDQRSSEIDLHLITHEPAAIRGLIDSPVHIYALAEIAIAGQVARVATRIN